LQNVVYELVTRGKRPLDHISNYAPFFENDKSWAYSEDGTASVAQQLAALLNVLRLLGRGERTCGEALRRCE